MWQKLLLVNEYDFPPGIDLLRGPGCLGSRSHFPASLAALWGLVTTFWPWDACAVTCVSFPPSVSPLPGWGCDGRPPWAHGHMLRAGDRAAGSLIAGGTLPALNFFSLGWGGLSENMMHLV